jgi:hypothetical protein
LDWVPLPSSHSGGSSVLSWVLYVLTIALHQIQTQMMLLVELTQVTAVEFQYRYTICKTLEDALTPYFPGLLHKVNKETLYFQSYYMNAWLCLSVNHLIFYVTHFSIGWNIGWIFVSIDLWRHTQTS